MAAPSKNDHASRMASISLGLKMALDTQVNPLTETTIDKLKIAFEQKSQSVLSLGEVKGVLVGNSSLMSRDIDKVAFFLFSAIDFAYMTLMRQWYVENHDENSTPYSGFKEIVKQCDTANSAFMLSQMRLSPTIEQMEVLSLEKLRFDDRFKESFGVSAVQRALRMGTGRADKLLDRCVANGLLVVNPTREYQVMFNSHKQ
ncbi:hypothetical protein ACQKQC_06045 [Vibrio fortis]|uniref:hypothetical protein n=1 Tax=Vibrio fortis TaxID=212667 RepID=UPI0040692342